MYRTFVTGITGDLDHRNRASTLPLLEVHPQERDRLPPLRIQPFNPDRRLARLARSLFRAIGVPLIAGIGVTCTDAPTAPRGATMTSAHVALSPSFSAEAASAAAALGDFDIAYDRVRIVLSQPTTKTVALDTTVAFGPNSAPLSLDLKVKISTREAWFDALIEYRDANGVLFSGTVRVLARAVNEIAAPPTPVNLVYVGPGANAVRLVVSPSTTALPASRPVTFSATAFDKDGAPVQVPLAWTVSDPNLVSVSGRGPSITVTASEKQVR